jgi:2-keto-3-deoxy-L-fuconate dehydrogenase
VKRFEGRVALVTGGGSGIGRAAAERLAAEGAAVRIANRGEEAGKEVVAAIGATGGTARYATVDVADEASVIAMFEVLGAAYGPELHVLVNSAGTVATTTAAQGIRVNCVCPGTIDSPWIERLVADGASRDDLVARQPIGRLGTPEEVAEAILYLASDQAGFSTGSSLVVDGGMTAG